MWSRPPIFGGLARDTAVMSDLAAGGLAINQLLKLKARGLITTQQFLEVTADLEGSVVERPLEGSVMERPGRVDVLRICTELAPSSVSK